MAQDSFKNLVFGMLLFGLFVTMFLGWASSLGTEYDKDVSEISGGAYDTSAIDSMLGTVSSDVEDKRERFESGSMTDVDNAVGVFSVMKSIVGFLFIPWDLLSGILTNVLNIPAPVTGVILSILILSIIFGTWRLVRAGD